jgi:fumarate hydratase class II
MPGKVNPVIAESLLQVTAQVFGNDATITYAGQSGVFELNMMWPVAAYNLLQSIQLLAAGASNFTTKCLDGITATTRGPESVSKGLALVTALVPRIGYDAAAAIAHEASETGETVHEVAMRRTSLTAEELTSLLDPTHMICQAS